MFVKIKEYIYGNCRILALFILATASALTFSLDLKGTQSGPLDSGTILGAILLVTFFLLYKKTLLIKADGSKPGKILSVLFALIMVLGASYHANGTAVHLFSNPKMFILALFCVFGYSIFFCAAIRFIFLHLIVFVTWTA